MINQTKNIRNILFDLGNVIIELDESKSEDAMAALTDMEYDAFLQDSDEIFRKYETGKIGEDEFLYTLIGHSDDKVGAEEIVNAWNAMLLGIPKERIETLAKYKERFRIYVLSNTNPTHIKWVNAYLVREHGLESLDEVFDHCYYSYEIGERKPGKAAFSAVLNHAGIEAEHTLFIDDLLANVKAGIDAGLPSVHLPKGKSVEELLERLFGVE